MGKYALVASHYDQYRNEFLNELIINIPNFDLTKLENIDNFTSDKTNLEIMNIIKETNNITNQNFLSIVYYKNKSSKPNYFKVIYNNPLIHELSNNTEVRLIGTKQHSYATSVKHSNLFMAEFKNIENMLEKKDISELISKFGENHQLIYLANNYLACDPFDYEGISECFNLLKNEFSRYKTFRGWIVNKAKHNKKTADKIKQEKIIPKTISEYESEYEKNFEDKQNKTYLSSIKENYNLKYLDEDKEEFIEEDELEQMGYHK